MEKGEKKNMEMRILVVIHTLSNVAAPVVLWEDFTH